MLLASGSKDGENLLIIGFTGERVSLCMGCLVESTLWLLCTDTQNSQKRNGALGEGLS